MNYTRHQLDDECWIDTYKLPEELMPTQEERELLWDIHPEKRGEIRAFGATKSPRWFQSYEKPYHFSGVEHLAASTPDLIHRYLDWVKTTQYEEDNGEGSEDSSCGTYNQCLVNWYQNGHDYISPHADDENHMYPRTPIICISFGETRQFRIRRPDPDPKAKPKSPIVLDLEIEDGMVYVMG